MEKIKNWLESKVFWLRTGAKLEIANDGKPVKELVIRYKDYYFGIMLDAETGEPTGGFGWSEDPGMFPSVPIREHLTVGAEGLPNAVALLNEKKLHYDTLQTVYMLTEQLDMDDFDKISKRYKDLTIELSTTQESRGV